MNKARSGSLEVFALKYGRLESLLGDLTGGRGEAIVIRFRKLRPKFAADGLLSETGTNLSYDLTRVLAIWATYELNALSIPQGSAVDIVVANWPEIARACLTAWHQSSTHDSTTAGRKSSVVRIYINALTASPKDSSWASLLPDAIQGNPHVALDCGPVIDAVVDAAEQSGQSIQLVHALTELEGAFGWDELGQNDPHRLPSRPESGFFGTGPYFERARALLSISDASFLRTRERLRLQAYLDYLEAPPPIDAWKQFISSDGEKEGLGFLISAAAFNLGLKSNFVTNHTLASRAEPADERALDLIERGEKRLAQIVEEARS